jgi:polyhydroxyalkanoate synthesis repressor PhaR
VGIGSAGERATVIKYPNRRLYDTAESRYIRWPISAAGAENIDFVCDKKSQQDITRMILLQVIAEQEHGQSVLSREFLSQVIRSHGQAAKEVLGSYLEQSLRLFNAQQRDIKDRIKQATGVDSLESAGAMAERNYQRWRSVEDDIFRTLVGAVTGHRPRADNPDSDNRP